MSDVFDLTHTREETSSSKGNLKKLEVIIDDNKYYIKTGRTRIRGNEGKYGIEPIVECLVSEMARILEIPHASYELCLAKVITNGESSVQLATMSKDMRENGDALIYAQDLYTAGIIKAINYDTLKSVMSNPELLDKMLVLDYIVCNEDRHGRNIAFTKDGELFKMTPVFDNGYSLLYDDLEGMQGNYMRAVRLCNCNAFYNNFNGALKLVMRHTHGDIINKLKIPYKNKGTEIIHAIRDIYFQAKDLQDFHSNINVPSREWFERVYEFLLWRLDTLYDCCEEAMEVNRDENI